jgi:hypothetical protein
LGGGLGATGGAALVATLVATLLGAVVARGGRGLRGRVVEGRSLLRRRLKTGEREEQDAGEGEQVGHGFLQVHREGGVLIVDTRLGLHDGAR